MVWDVLAEVEIALEGARVVVLNVVVQDVAGCASHMVG